MFGSQCFCADVYRKCSFTMLNVQLLKIQTKLHLLLHIKSCQPARGFYCETAIGKDNVCGGNDLFKEGLQSKMLMYSAPFRYIEVE